MELNSQHNFTNQEKVLFKENYDLIISIVIQLCVT